ncbi:unnamed protein product, partial [Urochloa humidicola]
RARARFRPTGLCFHTSRKLYPPARTHCGISGFDGSSFLFCCRSSPSSATQQPPSARSRGRSWRRPARDQGAARRSSSTRGPEPERRRSSRPPSPSPARGVRQSIWPAAARGLCSPPCSSVASRAPLPLLSTGRSPVRLELARRRPRRISRGPVRAPARGTQAVVVLRRGPNPRYHQTFPLPVSCPSTSFPAPLMIAGAEDGCAMEGHARRSKSSGSPRHQMGMGSRWPGPAARRR